MPIIFPNPNEATPEGLLAVGGNLETETLIEAYSQGIFPWPIGENYPLTWFSPDPRGVIFLDHLHLPHSLEKFIKKTNYKVFFNRNFETVIKECALSPHRKDGQKTWILPEMQKAYIDLFKMGYAFCVEVDYEGELAGGLYGVNLGWCLAGESMFYKKDNGSKIALFELCLMLKSKGLLWLDTQMVTEVTELLGAQNISRNNFLDLLAKAREKKGEVLNFPSPNHYLFNS